MKIIITIVILSMLVCNSFAQKELFDNAVDYANGRFTEKYLQSVNINEFDSKFSDYSIEKPIEYNELVNGLFSYTITNICRPINQIKNLYRNNLSSEQSAKLIVDQIFLINKIQIITSQYPELMILKQELLTEITNYFVKTKLDEKITGIIQNDTVNPMEQDNTEENQVNRNEEHINESTKIPVWIYFIIPLSIVLVFIFIYRKKIISLLTNRTINSSSLTDEQKIEITEFIRKENKELKKLFLEKYQNNQRKLDELLLMTKSLNEKIQLQTKIPGLIQNEFIKIFHENKSLINVIRELKNNLHQSVTDANKISSYNFKENVINNAQSAMNQKTNDTLITIIKINKEMRIPNAQVNKEYFVQFDFPSINLVINGLESTGLVFNSDTNQLTGIPAVAGDFPLTLFSDNFRKEVTLTINPDPKALWKNIPSDQNIRYPKPDNDSFLQTQNEKSIIAASQRGRSHAHAGTPRDDHFAIEIVNDWYIIAVADGAGSAKYSRKGSELACIKSIENIKEILKNDPIFLESIINYQTKPTEVFAKEVRGNLYNIFGNACITSYNAIAEEAKINGSATKDYATTIMLGICKKINSEYFIAAFWIGDGAVSIYQQNQKVHLMGEVDSGEFAGQTRFLTMPEMMKPEEIYRRVRFDLVKDFTAFVLMTDGVSDAKFETENNLNNVAKWDELWTDLKKEVNFSKRDETTQAQLLSWLDFWSQGNHDDRTIAILY